MLDDLRVKEFTKDEARRLNPLQLALVGDAVYETYIRSYILTENSELSVHKIHVKAIKYVKAKSQSDIIKALENDLTEEEEDIFKRGRNAKSGSIPKNADVIDYKNATGFEALVGYLYLTGAKERLELVFKRAIEII